jgi:UDP-GlcNAc:undecaprenyl-phosphate GlcNAc-1-phosphate transferase
MPALLLPTLVIFIFGLWDDAKGLPALTKLAGQVAAVLLMMALGIHIRIFESPRFFIGGQSLVFQLLDWGLTLFWMIGITNAFNLVDSMDGLAVGLSGWSFAFFMLATLDTRQEGLSIMSALMVGICLALYYYNGSPAKLFLGDSGAQTFGFLLAAIAILYTPTETAQTSSWFVPILLLGVPIFDTTLVFFSRIRRGKYFYQAGTDHTYHRLVALGMAPPRAVLTMHMAALLLQCVAFVAVTLQPLWANLIFAAALAVGLFAVLFLDHPGRWPAPEPRH